MTATEQSQLILLFSYYKYVPNTVVYTSSPFLLFDYLLFFFCSKFDELSIIFDNLDSDQIIRKFGQFNKLYLDNLDSSTNFKQRKYNFKPRNTDQIIKDMDNSSFNCLSSEELSIHILIVVPSLTIEGLRSTFSTQAGAGKISGILTESFVGSFSKIKSLQSNGFNHYL